MTFEDALLRAVRRKAIDIDTHRKASTATVAVWTIGKKSAAPKSLINQLGVGVRMNQMPGRGNL